MYDLYILYCTYNCIIVVTFPRLLLYAILLGKDFMIILFVCGRDTKTAKKSIRTKDLNSIIYLRSLYMYNVHIDI